MTPITQRMVRAAKWVEVYAYDSKTTRLRTYACEAIPNLVITHEKIGKRRSKSYYTVVKPGDTPNYRTHSIIQAIRVHNEEIKKQLGGGRHAPGSVEQARQSRGDAGL